MSAHVGRYPVHIETQQIESSKLVKTPSVLPCNGRHQFRCFVVQLPAALRNAVAPLAIGVGVDVATAITAR